MKKTFTPVTTIPGVDTHKILARAHAGEIRVVSTACGFQTSRTCAQVKAGCTSPRSPMRIPAGSRGWAMDSHMVTFPGRQSPGNGSNTAR